MTGDERGSQLLQVVTAPAEMISRTGNSRAGIGYATTKNDVRSMLEGFDDTKGAEVRLGVNRLVLPVG